jgi:hypothetical protein
VHARLTAGAFAGDFFRTKKKRELSRKEAEGYKQRMKIREKGYLRFRGGSEIAD